MKRATAMLALLGLAVSCASAGCAGSTAARSGAAEAQTGPRRPFEHAPENLVQALAAISQELRGVGLVQYGPSASGFLPAGGRQAFAIELPGDRCMTLIAIATPGVTDMDAALYTPDGEVLASDSQPDSHPAIHVCGTGETRTVYYVVHSYEGAGSFLMASFSGGRQAVDAVASRLGGRPAVATDIHGEGDLQARMTDFGEGLLRRGFRRRGDPTLLSLAETQRMRVSIPVDAGRCYAVAAFGEETLSRVDLRIIDGAGDEVVYDRAPLSEARVQFCAHRSEAFAAEAHAAAGDGRAVLLVFEAQAHEVLGEGGLWLGRTGKLASADRPRDEALAKASEHARQAGFATLEARFAGQLGVGEAVEHRLQVGKRHCFRFVFDAAQTLMNAELQLLRPGIERRSFMLPAASVDHPVELCATTGETLTLRLVAETGSGDYSLSVFSR